MCSSKVMVTPLKRWWATILSKPMVGASASCPMWMVSRPQKSLAILSSAIVRDPGNKAMPRASPLFRHAADHDDFEFSLFHTFLGYSLRNARNYPRRFDPYQARVEILGVRLGDGVEI